MRWKLILGGARRGLNLKVVLIQNLVFNQSNRSLGAIKNA